MAHVLTQIILRGVCLLLAAFFLFGFLASFEPGVSTAWKVGYATVLVLALSGALVPWQFLRFNGKRQDEAAFKRRH